MSAIVVIIFIVANVIIVILQKKSGGKTVGVIDNLSKNFNKQRDKHLKSAVFNISKIQN